MQIVFSNDENLSLLFPEHKKFGSDQNVFLDEIKKYFSFGPYIPKVSISDDLIIVDIDTPTILRHDSDYQKVVSLCTKGKYDIAKPILQRLIKENPSVSEYHRISGQIFYDEGNQDVAIDSLSDALRWDPKNDYALIMMGNIFAKFKNDITTAKKYYDLSLASNPNNNITLYNIGANFLQLGHFEEGKRYLEMAYEINPSYPNTSYGFALYYHLLGNHLECFDWAIKGYKLCDNKNPLKEHFRGLLFSSSRDYLTSFDGSLVVDSYIDYLQEKGGKEIKKQIDNTISTAAVIEFAEVHNRKYHLIRYQEKYPAFNHLIMHELVHLNFVLQAREFNDSNKLFITSVDRLQKFLDDHDFYIKKLETRGLSGDAITDFGKSIFTGINLQIYNAPIDVFIEEFLFTSYPQLRPLQFISMDILLNEALKIVTLKEKKFIPPVIYNASLVLNLVMALQFRSLFALDYIPQFAASGDQLNLAKKFYDKFQSKKENRAPGEEYALIKEWAADLNITSYFELVNEKDHFDKNYLYNKIKEIEEDPFSLNIEHPKDALKEPLSFSNSPAGQMAVTMYCLDALQYFEDKSAEKIKEVGFEIAMLGTQGLDPSNSSKKIPLASIPNKKFTALHLLAFMYVAWQSIDPTLDSTLDFKDEFEMAKSMFKKDK